MAASGTGPCPIAPAPPRERLFLRLREDATQGPESELPAGTLRSVPVDAALRPHVAHILVYRETLADSEPVIERVLPDGALRLMIHLDESPTGVAATACVMGASAAPALVPLRGRMHGLSLTLQPGAAAALLGLPAGELPGLPLPLRELLGDDADRLLEQMERIGHAAADDARVALLQRLLLARLSRAASAPSPGLPLATRALALIDAAGGQRPLREVAAAVGVGERRLQQVFHEQVGLTPRTAGRLARLHHLVRALRRDPAEPWAQLAAGGGYYDQAHLANEFRALSGMTPSAFRARRAASASSKTTG